MHEVWAQLAASVLTFLGICVPVFWANTQGKTRMEKKVDQLVEHDEDQYLSILRLTIMNSEMPISERIIAGDKYEKKGGNGEVKQYYKKMLEEHTK